MSANPGSPGYSMPDDENTQNRKQRDAERSARENAASRSLAASQIGAGGLTISGGGSLTIAAGGSLNVASGALNSGGSISAGTTITAGGAISGGSLNATNAITGASLSVPGNLSGGAITGASVSVSGNVSGANVTGGSVFAQSLTTNITATRVTLWGRSADGFIGTASSSERFKSNIRPVDFDPQQVLKIAVSYFEYNDEISKRDDPNFDGYVGPDYHVSTNIGVIAERLHALGLWQFVVYDRDDDGALVMVNGQPVPYGVHDILLCYALLPVLQMQDKRITALTAQVNTLSGGGGLSIPTA